MLTILKLCLNVEAPVLYLAAVSPRMAVGLFMILAPQSGTCCQKNIPAVLTRAADFND